MIRALCRAAAVALALLAAPLAHAQASPAPLDAIVALLNQGRIEEGEKALRERLARDPGDAPARLLLGRVLDFDGRPDEAVAAWKEGLRGTAADYSLWMSIGALHARRGDQGPTVSNRRGMSTFQPDQDPAASAKFKREQQRLALEAYGKAAASAPAERAPLEAVATLNGKLGEHDAAVQAWRALTERDPGNARYALALGQAQWSAGRKADAALALERATVLDPRLAEAHARLAEHHAAAGRAAEAEHSRAQAAFYKGLPPFTTLRYSPQAAQTLGRLNDRGTVEKLAADPSAEAAAFLAALAWRHPHNALEDMAFASLDRRGDAAIGMVRDLFRGAQSTCTIRGSARILARQKDEGLLEQLLRLLPRDLNFPGIEMDVAGALDILGDERAVAPLAQLLNPGDRSPEDRSSPEAAMSGRPQARARAALALGAFDTPQARAALTQGLEHPELAPYAAAALYRLSRGDARYEPALQRAAESADPYALYRLPEYLRRIGTPAAAKLAEQMEQRRRSAAKKG